MHNIDFIKELASLKEPVWKKIQEYLPIDIKPIEHYRMVRDYPERKGKYFRPGLVLLSAKMHGGDIEKAILTAAAMQVSEDWLLIHDDFEDHSLERRSTKDEYRPTLNMKYGDELAVNAGDSLHLIMWKILGDNVRLLGEELGWKIYDKMNDVLLKTTEGQFYELNWIRNNQINITEQDYYEMINRKSAYYTTIGPLQLGAIVSGNTGQEELEKITGWAKPFGYAFQIWDDIMNLTEESRIQGKETAGDILEGKRTLILIDLLKHVNEEEYIRLAGIYFKKREAKTEDDKDYVLDLMTKFKSIEYAKDAANEYAQDAKRKFEDYATNYPDSPAKDIIREGIEFVVSRDH